ncbi:hypothetical protein L2E82_47111 [Cichorium intybus]|uniref:Uncharacterized protein n=1 Tax=Cichorium intybus TaxID=13427 RepID=A0ACB8YV96_CICIN|nr:hypothetical protein L2E82_47111 [Cichorium intybus]
MCRNQGRVLVAVDGSEERMNALKWAIDYVKLRLGGSLVIIHVQQPPSIAASLNPSPIPFAYTVLPSSSITADLKLDVITATVKLKADLLVMGCRSFGSVKR